MQQTGQKSPHLSYHMANLLSTTISIELQHNQGRHTCKQFTVKLNLRESKPDLVG